ncbi:FAD synthase isoform X2 [Scaptodrosophila lebanonensis]|nr:FAD synthase isoform X2 [Scaptodrosophila lebanonensis]
MNKCCTHTQTTIATSNVTTAPTALQPRSKCVLALGSNSSNKHMSEKLERSDSKASLPLTADIRVQIEGRMQTAFDFFTQTLELYSVDQLMFCFNGGKDCTVLLDLLMRYCRLHSINSRDIPMLYIKSDDAFAEIDEFVARCVRHYNVQLIEYKESLKEALTHMSADMPRIKAVFVGSRNTDPYCEHLEPMSPTDNGWPAMMRLNPLLQWSYHDVWHYIHMYNVPYCRLYDQGYTSIGYRSNTVPNPHLLRCESDTHCANDGTCCYRPAWELEDATQERAGRIARKQ